MSNQLREFVLREGLDDWVPFEALRGECPDATDDERVSLVRELAAEGLVEIGDLRHGPFRAWPGDVDDWIPRMRELLAGQDPVLAIWLSNTAAGDAVARS